MGELIGFFVFLLECALICGVGHFVDRKLKMQGLGLVIWLFGAVPFCAVAAGIILCALILIPTSIAALFA